MFKFGLIQLRALVLVAHNIQGHYRPRTVSVFKMASKSKEFDKILLSSIDEAMLSLGESARQSIYYHLETKFAVKREEISLDLEGFQTALEKIFGIGARYLEILIMKNLYAKIGRSLKVKNNEQLEFVKYVNAAKRGYTQETSIKEKC
jgi:hypothetical protein